MFTKKDLTVVLIKRKYRKSTTEKQKRKLNILFSDISLGIETGYERIPVADIGYWIELKLSYISVD